MKQFNLEEYLKKPHLNIVTRSGLPVRIVCIDRVGTDDRPILALVKINDDNEIAIEYTKEGKYYRKQDSDYDLFFSPEKKEGYVIVRDSEEGTRYISGYVYNTYDEAKNTVGDDYIAIAKIEWEE